MRLEFDMRMKCGKCGNEDKHHFDLKYKDDDNIMLSFDNQIVFRKGFGYE